MTTKYANKEKYPLTSSLEVTTQERLKIGSHGNEFDVIFFLFHAFRYTKHCWLTSSVTL